MSSEKSHTKALHIIATRKSRLAIVQAQMIADALMEANSNSSATLLPLTTAGDQQKKTEIAKIGGKGVFTREIENALLEGKANIAMHSLKDMPMEMPNGLMLAGVLKRNDPRDILISATPITHLNDLKKHAVIGTSSPRRTAQILAVRPDLKISPFRGNVPTRLQKLEAAKVDATILAAAGLERLKLTPQHSLTLSIKQALPAIGQGLIAIQCRTDDDITRKAIEVITDKVSWYQALAERAFLYEIEGDCHSPLAGHAIVNSAQTQLTITGCIYAENGQNYSVHSVTGSIKDAEELGRQCAKHLSPRAKELWKNCS